MANIENRVVEDVKGLLVDKIDNFEVGYLEGVDGSELAFELLAEENANGTVTYSRAKALDYLHQNPAATSATIQLMIDDFGYDWEDVYLNGEDYEEYIETEAERVQVIMYIELARNILSLCPTIAACHDVRLGSRGDGVMEQVKEELLKVPASEAWL